jgi:hypothetical protein
MKLSMGKLAEQNMRQGKKVPPEPFGVEGMM